MSVRELLGRLIDNIESVIIGKSEAVKLLVVALIARGHVLIEDVPGVGKTTLARSLARSIHGEFQRVQFTPDLLPSDILGVSVYNTQTNEFSFKRGPVFANIVLADEINRTTPRTQSALLEAMNEFQVSIDGATHVLPDPFMVVATQNPIEYAGTYPLPESQLDRFLLRIAIGYPSPEDEHTIIAGHRLAHPIESLGPVLSGAQVLELQAAARQVMVERSLVDYLLEVVGKTRTHETLLAGISPRGSLAIYRAAQALALVEGRDFVIPDDIKRLIVPVFAHRVIEKAAFDRQGTAAAAAILADILEATTVPV